jgi:anti-sigma regulatory factor (Ser/Thr protein kinase)
MEAITVPARLEALGAIGAYVLKAAEAGSIDQRAAYRLRLAVDEIATNVIQHGRPGEQADETILVKPAIDDEGVTIVLEDAGPAFNPLERQEPLDLDQPAEQRPVGGLGVFLAIRGVDRFEYNRVGNINRHTLFVRRGSLERAGTR